jgi:GNAT superfamily N-acetyltransferase
MGLRPIRAGDAAAVARLSAQLGYPSDEAAIERRLAALAELPESLVLVAEEDGEVLGWVHVLGQHRVETDAFAEVAGLVVDERARGRGLGRDLLAAAEAWAGERGFGAMRVRSNTRRADAHRFYERERYSLLKTQANFHKTLG